jgi:hypothetical protein
VLWELSGTGQARHRRALRLIAAAFLALAAYLTVQTRNAALGWWWADPAAGPMIIYYGLKEARSIRTDLRSR